MDDIKNILEQAAVLIRDQYKDDTTELGKIMRGVQVRSSDHAIECGECCADCDYYDGEYGCPVAQRALRADHAIECDDCDECSEYGVIGCPVAQRQQTCATCAEPVTCPISQVGCSNHRDEQEVARLFGPEIEIDDETQKRIEALHNKSGYATKEELAELRAFDKVVHSRNIAALRNSTYLMDEYAAADKVDKPVT